MIHPGEIWTLNGKNDKESEVLIVAYNDNIATILYLMDECKDGCVPCGFDEFTLCKYVNPRMLNWTWGGYLGKRVQKLNLQAIAEISVAIEKVLSVKIEREAVVTVNPNEVDHLKADKKALLCRCRELDDKAAKSIEMYKQANEEALKYKIQLDTIKEMYSDLMEKYLQKG